MNNELKPYIQYIHKNSNEQDINLYQKALLDVDDAYLKMEFFKGISNRELLLGMKKILKDDLHTLAATFIATILSFRFVNNNDIPFLEKEYSSEISRIVEGIQKIRSLNFEKALEQPDMQRKLVLSVARDTRSLLILLAGNLYLLRNYNRIVSLEQKLDVLHSSISVFIPIAHRLGFYKIKSELEDLVLSINEPEMFLSIKTQLSQSELERNKIINKFISPLILEMNAHGLNYTIKSRLKSINSIYNKMKAQKIPFAKVYDLWAIRIILDSEPKNEKASCWHAYSIVTNLYEPSLSRIRDWITVPKSNGYESLHTTVKSEDGRWTEVQIRTTRMDEEAENGMAAHWRYKGGKMTRGVDFWLSEIRKAIGSEDGNSPKSQLSPEKFANEVFVFTPSGDLKKLKYGATILDFAYAIHSEVGNKCINAKVNGKIVPIKQVLKNGDQVEINTSKNQKPSADWINWVVSTRTKTKIRKALDEQKNKEIKRGKEILERKFKNWKIDFSQEVIDELVVKLDLKEHYDLFYNVSIEKIDPLHLKKIVLDGANPDVNTKLNIEAADIQNVSDEVIESGHKDILIIEKIDNINYKLAKCCNPIQGDKIFGFVTVANGITIHRNKCPNAAEMKKRYPYRIIETKWRAGKRRVNFKTGIKILGSDSLGLANKITQVISNDMKLNIISMTFELKNGYYEGKIGLLVSDSDHLEALLERLRSIKGVSEVFRQDL